MVFDVAAYRREYRRRNRERIREYARRRRARRWAQRMEGLLGKRRRLAVRLLELGLASSRGEADRMAFNFYLPAQVKGKREYEYL